MLFYVIVVIFFMTLLMNKFTSVGHPNLRLVQTNVNYSDKVWNILHLNNEVVVKYCHG